MSLKSLYLPLQRYFWCHDSICSFPDLLTYADRDYTCATIRPLAQSLSTMQRCQANGVHDSPRLSVAKLNPQGIDSVVPYRVDHSKLGPPHQAFLINVPTTSYVSSCFPLR